MAQVVWFKKSKGLATRFDPSRIQYDKTTGVQYLAEAYNVDYGFTGGVFRRKGFEAAGVTGNCHSFFCNGGPCLFVKDNGLFLLAEDMSVTELRSGISSPYYSFCQVGDAIVYMNGHHSGIIRNNTNYAYTMPTDVKYPDQTRVYNDPPIGEIVRFFAGRGWIVKGNTLYYSEPFALNLFRLSTNYIPFPAKITMVAPVQGGIFVSTASKIYFLKGNNPNEFVMNTVAHYPAIKGTDVEADGIAILAGSISPLPVQIFTTTKGICVGTANGTMQNLTYETLEYPYAVRGCAVYSGNKYIVSLDGDKNLTLCLTLNIAAVSQYANFDFDGMCKFNDNIVGGDSSGLYTLLSGETDDGTAIPAHFRTGPTSFEVENEKRLRRMYVTMRNEGTMKFSVSCDDKEDVVKEVTAHDTTLRIIHQQVQGGRDIRGKHLDLKVSNVNGADFTISEIQAVLIVKRSKTAEVI